MGRTGTLMRLVSSSHWYHCRPLLQRLPCVYVQSAATFFGSGDMRTLPPPQYTPNMLGLLSLRTYIPNMGFGSGDLHTLPPPHYIPTWALGLGTCISFFHPSIHLHGLLRHFCISVSPYGVLAQVMPQMGSATKGHPL